MDITGINMHTVVRVDLTPYGRSVYKAYMDAEAGRDLGPRDSEPVRVAHEVAKRTPQDLNSHSLPLWELLRIFGPATRSSTRLPFEGFDVRLPPSRELVEAKAEARKASEGRDKATSLLQRVSIALGLTNDYTAPEIAAHCLRMWTTGYPERVPFRDGWWWYGDRPVQVEGSPGRLTWRIGNGKRKPIGPADDSDPLWGGPVLRDTRVKQLEAPKPETGDDSEDTPF